MSTRHLNDHRPKTPAPGKENADINILHKPSRTRKAGRIGISESFDSVSEKSCETPKSEANKIPQTLTCPPAPKKPTRRALVLSCKRKLMAEFEFFEADRRQEVDEFFRSSFDRISDARARARNVVVTTASTSIPAALAGSAAVSSSSSSSSSPSPLACN